MADSKISALTSATTPLAGTEVLPIVQGGATKQVSVANLTASRAVSADTITQNINYTTARAASAPTYGGNYYIYSGAGLNTADGGIEWQYATAGNGYGFKMNVDGGSDAWQLGYRKNSASWTLALAVDYNGNATVSNGNLVQGTAAKGVNFTANTPAAGMTSQLLNWYEEGTWTPTITSQSGSLTSYTSMGYYTRVGRMLHVFGSFAITDAGTASGQASISGLPFSSFNLPAGPDVIGTGVVREYNNTGNAYFINVTDNATTATIVSSTNGGIVWTNGYGYLWTVTYQLA